MNEKAVDRVHWSFWPIAAAGLVFNLLGCLNFISQMNAENVAAMPDVYRAIVETRPAWGSGVFALAVFGGLLGCLLLLLKRSAAFFVFAVALPAAIAAQIPFLGMADFPVEAWLGWSSQVLIGAFLLWYSSKARTRGWIR